jgi:hypothetical protein
MKSTVLSKDLSTKTNDHDDIIIPLQRMNDKLSHPPKLFQGETNIAKTNTVVSPTTAQFTTSISSAKQGSIYQMNPAVDST